MSTLQGSLIAVSILMMLNQLNLRLEIKPTNLTRIRSVLRMRNHVRLQSQLIHKSLRTMWTLQSSFKSVMGNHHMMSETNFTRESQIAVQTLHRLLFHVGIFDMCSQNHFSFKRLVAVEAADSFCFAGTVRFFLDDARKGLVVNVSQMPFERTSWNHRPVTNMAGVISSVFVNSISMDDEHRVIGEFLATYLAGTFLEASTVRFFVHLHVETKAVSSVESNSASVAP